MPRDNFSGWSKQELIERIHQIEKRKKYGLVWDEERTKERFEAEAENSLPVLVEDPDLAIVTDPDQPTHILIEGDNYHALSVLNYTKESSVDLIYVDPPYNTGSNSWRYNNQFIESDDAFRHSKWLSFMSKRLNLAKRLLKKTGILAIAIDDYELSPLVLLLDEIFGENNRLGIVVIENNPRGRTTNDFFATSHEYCLFYAKDSLTAKILDTPLTDEQVEKFNLEDGESQYRLLPFRRSGGLSTPDERPNSYYPLYYNELEDKISISSFYNSVEILPIDTKGNKRVWRFTNPSRKPSVTLAIEKGDLVVKKINGEYTVYMKDRIKSGRKIKTVWVNPKYDSSTHGTVLLETILGESKTFPYPKSLYAVRDVLLSVIRKNKFSVVVDFFAGSGTTAHAVMELNQEDGGKRQCILVTNNENNIMTEVCYPRVQRVIQGYEYQGKDKTLLFERKLTLNQLRKANEIYAEYQQAREENRGHYDELKGEFTDNTIRLWGFTVIDGLKDGLGGNLKFYRTAFVPAEPTDENKETLTYRSVEMLCLRENTFDFVTETGIWKIYENQQQYTGILFDQLSIPAFKQALDELEDKPVSVYVFSLGNYNFATEFEDMGKRVKVCSIPEAILKVYRRHRAI